MDKKELLRRLGEGGLSDTDMLRELQEELDRELAKPDSEIDLDYTSQLTEAIRAIVYSDAPMNEQANISALTGEVRAQSRRTKLRRIFRSVMTAAACFVVGLAVHSYNSIADGDGVFSQWITQQQGGIVIDMNEEDFEDEPVTTTTNSEAGLVTSTARPENPETTTTTRAALTTEEVTALETTGYSPQTTTTTTTTHNAQETEAVTTTSAASQGDDNSIAAQMAAKYEEYGVKADVMTFGSRRSLYNSTLNDFSYDEYEDSTDMYFYFVISQAEVIINVEMFDGAIPNEQLPVTEGTEYEIYSNPPTYIAKNGDYITAVYHRPGENILYTITMLPRNGEWSSEEMYWEIVRSFMSYDDYTAMKAGQ